MYGEDTEPRGVAESRARHRSFALVNRAALGNGYWQY
jgi:hypothetical protein